ncbi:hypothetical protein F4776DRAFT_673615 [Hypoxylon sp. NC0597]|nr:hypothetical protein F4776DRAFT_673615 [Hypoxylon sp. NC0597]
MSEDEILPTSTLARRLLAEEYNLQNGNMLSKGEALWWSAAGGRLDLARLLIDEGAEHGRSRRCAKRPAMINSHNDAARLLLARFGVPIDSWGQWGKTALHITASRNNYEGITMLVYDFGADIHYLDHEGHGATLRLP